MVVRLLSTFLLALIPFFFNGSYNLIIDILNAIILALSESGIAVVGLFPPNPCGSIVGNCTEVVTWSVSTELLNKVLSVVAWLLPIQFLVDLVGCAMLTVMIYFTMAPVARWLKLIS